MKPAKIRYKGYEWEHNPETLQMLKEENISERKFFSGKSYAVKNSTKCRRIIGKGILAGADCLKQFNELLKIQSDTQSGILTLPRQKPFYAYFKKLELLAEPVSNAVTYSFEFIEDSEREYIQNEKFYYTVKDEQTLWDISYNIDVPIETLVSLNPDIKRVDELEIGSKVRVC